MGVLNTTPRTWVAGETVTAAEMNAEIRDALTNLQNGWVAYTPTLTNITLGNGTVDARYERIGQTILFQIRFTFGSTSALTASRPVFTLPVNTRSALWGVNVIIFDTSAGAWYDGKAVASTASSVTTFTLPTTAGNAMRDVTSTSPMTWATGDVLTITGIYEAA